MIEAAGSLGLAPEARVVLIALGRRHEVGFLQDLHGHGPGEARVDAQVDDAHGAGAELLEHLVASEKGGSGSVHLGGLRGEIRGMLDFRCFHVQRAA